MNTHKSIVWYDPFALKSKRPKTEIARMLLDAWDRYDNKKINEVK